MRYTFKPYSINVNVLGQLLVLHDSALNQSYIVGTVNGKTTAALDISTKRLIMSTLQGNRDYPLTAGKQHLHRLGVYPITFDPATAKAVDIDPNNDTFFQPIKTLMASTFRGIIDYQKHFSPKPSISTTSTSSNSKSSSTTSSPSTSSSSSNSNFPQLSSYSLAKNRLNEQPTSSTCSVSDAWQIYQAELSSAIKLLKRVKTFEESNPDKSQLDSLKSLISAKKQTMLNALQNYADANNDKRDITEVITSYITYHKDTAKKLIKRLDDELDITNADYKNILNIVNTELSTIDVLKILRDDQVEINNAINNPKTAFEEALDAAIYAKLKFDNEKEPTQKQKNRMILENKKLDLNNALKTDNVTDIPTFLSKQRNNLYLETRSPEKEAKAALLDELSKKHSETLDSKSSDLDDFDDFVMVPK